MGDADLIRQDCLKLLQAAYNDKVKECHKKDKQIEQLRRELHSKETTVIECMNQYLIKDQEKMKNEVANLTTIVSLREEDNRNLRMANNLLMERLTQAKNKIMIIQQDFLVAQGVIAHLSKAKNDDGGKKNDHSENI